MMDQIEKVKEFGGHLTRYTHDSSVCNCKMTFSVYLPPQAVEKKVPVLYWLSGLTCTDENASTKLGAQRFASKYGIAIIFPDTSPRGGDVPDVSGRYDLGQGAGFYVNSTQRTWTNNFQMYDYVTKELPELLEKNLPLIPEVKSISGHSMGGHGALICALKAPDSYKSASAFAPICNPVNCGWGKGCFAAYLGDDINDWKEYDATCLIQEGVKLPYELLIDLGADDEFLEGGQLLPDNLLSACKKNGMNINYRMHDGYDHSFQFISTFIDEHIAYHAKHLL
ncbi:MAG: S-formylglutathione hydrolase [bacterium]|nr:S-formylglutathione hydrolase [bacterium]